MNALLDNVLSGTDKFASLSPTMATDDFAAIIDAAIIARQTIGDMQIDVTNPCFLAKITAEQVMNDVSDYATYALFAKLNLTNAAQYQKNLDTIRTRVQSDMTAFGQSHGDSGQAPTAAATQ